MLASDFGLIFARDHANVAAELARVARPGARLGFTAWKPDPKLGELYRRFTEEPLEGREASEWGREDHVEHMLGEDFELEFHDGTLWIETRLRRGAVGALLDHGAARDGAAREARRRGRRGVPPRVRRAVRGLPQGRRRLRAAPLPAHAREAALSDEAVELLRELIRVDTSNPPGNETAAAELLRDYLEDAGVECELYAKAPERANLVARLRGTGGGPSLALLSHTDVVPADAREWSADPFGGELRDGFVWGRGALDMKGQVAASAVALASLAREGWRHDGDLVFIAAADEEVGNGFGLDWLVREHPEACRADYAINEGGGDRVEIAGRALYLCPTAEKMSAPFLLRVHGRSGHASMPGIADNALVKAAPLIERLALLHAGAASSRPRPRRSSRRSGTASRRPPTRRSRWRARSRRSRPSWSSRCSGRRSRRRWSTASTRRNVIPAICEIAVDCAGPARRRPPTPCSRRSATSWARATVTLTELEPIERRGGTRSRARRRPLWEAIEAFVARGRARRAPSRRSARPGSPTRTGCAMAFGTVAYGFFPSRFDPETAARLIHSADERVPVDDLALGVRLPAFHGARVCR